MAHLACGCCGDGFEGPPDPANDVGYGTCPACMEWIADIDRKKWRGYAAKFARALNKSNRKKFLKLSHDLQQYVMRRAMEDGVAVWTIGGGKT